MAQSLVGQSKILAVTFKNVNGAETDPNQITLTITRIFQDEIEVMAVKHKVDLTRTDVGDYQYIYTPTKPGKYFGLYTTEDSPSAAVQDEWDVAAPVAP
jgi:hypothetical protein